MRTIFLAVLTALWGFCAQAQESLEYDILEFIEEAQYPAIDMTKCAGPILEVLRHTDFSKNDEVREGHLYLQARGCFSRYSFIEMEPPLPQGSMEGDPDSARDVQVEIELLPSWEMIPTGSTLYLRIRNFHFSLAEIEEGFEDLELRPGGLASFSRIILDMRGNPGGLVGLACELLGHFPRTFSSESYLQWKGGEREVWPTCVSLQQFASEAEVLLLVDEKTASAAEFVAAVLEKHEALLMGTRTYGKGLIQIENTFDPYVVRIVNGEFFSASGESFQGYGLEPTMQTSFGGCGEDLLCLLEHVSANLALHNALQGLAAKQAGKPVEHTAAVQ